MKATKAMLAHASKVESESELITYIHGIAIEKDLRMSEEQALTHQLMEEFKKHTVKVSWQVHPDKRGNNWMNVYMQVRNKDGRYSEVTSRSPKLFNTKLENAETAMQVLFDQLPKMIEEAKAKYSK